MTAGSVSGRAFGIEGPWEAVAGIRGGITVSGFCTTRERSTTFTSIGGGGGGGGSWKIGSIRVRTSACADSMGTCAGIINKPKAMMCRAMALLMPPMRAGSSRGASRVCVAASRNVLAMVHLRAGIGMQENVRRGETGLNPAQKRRAPTGPLYR